MPIAANDEPAVQRVLSASQQLATSNTYVVARTRYGGIRGGRLSNGVQAFLSESEGLATALTCMQMSHTAQMSRVGLTRYRCPMTTVTLRSRTHQAEATARRIRSILRTVVSLQLSALVSADRCLGRLRAATENPFFLDIYVPSTCILTEPGASLPVNVYIHGGSLQHGNTFENGHDQQWGSSERYQEVRVNVAYRYV
jgi:hypothetical protein